MAKKGFIAIASAPISRRWLKQKKKDSAGDAEAGSDVPTSGRFRSSSVSSGELVASPATVVPGNGMQRWHSSPERLRRVPEDEAVDIRETEGGEIDEEDSDFEEELEEQGLYQGSYRRLLATYTFAPLTFVVAFTVLAVLPTFLYPPHDDPDSPAYPFNLPFPLTELLVSAGFWSLSYLLRDPIFAFSLLLCQSTSLSHYIFPTVFSTTLHTIVSLLTRLASIPLVIPAVSQVLVSVLASETLTWRSPAFRRVWWLALGWAAAEAVVGIKQGYKGISLYRDVLVDIKARRVKANEDDRADGVDRIVDIEDSAVKSGGRVGSNLNSYGATEQELIAYSGSSSLSRDTSGGGGGSSSRAFEPEMMGNQGHEREPLLQRSRSDVDLILGNQNNNLEQSLELQVDQDLDLLMTVRARDDLERVYGMPFIKIPVFISCLQRINSLLLSLGFTLLLSSAYIRSTSIPSDSTALRSSQTLALISYSSGSFISPPYVHPFQMASPSALSFSSTSPSPLALTFTLVFLLHLFLSLLHTHLALPKIGVHTVVYIGSVISLGTFFVGLGMWGALGYEGMLYN